MYKGNRMDFSNQNRSCWLIREYPENNSECWHIVISWMLTGYYLESSVAQYSGLNELTGESL